MAFVKVINKRKGKKQSKYDLHRIIQYIKKQEAEGGLISGFNCQPESAYQEMLLNKRIFNKENGRMYIHMEQSFPKDQNLSPELVHEIGTRLISELNKFDNFQVLMATHTDKDHVHNHFCINSVGLDGKKWQLSDKELNDVIKMKSLELCEEYNIDIVFKEKVESKVKNKPDAAPKNSDNENKQKPDMEKKIDSFNHENSFIGAIRKAVIVELNNSIDFNNFRQNMQINHGIDVNVRGQTVTYRMDGMNQAIRGRRLGMDCV